MSKLNPQKATAYVGPGVLRKGGKITPVPNGPLIKKKGPYAGSTLRSGGAIKKAQNGKTTTTKTTKKPIPTAILPSMQTLPIKSKPYTDKQKDSLIDSWKKEIDSTFLKKNGSKIKKAQNGEYVTQEGKNYTATKKVKTKNGPRYYQGKSPSMSFSREIASDKARKINDSIPKAKLSARALEVMNQKNGGKTKKAMMGSSMFKDNPIYKKSTEARGMIGNIMGIPGKPIVKNGDMIKRADGSYSKRGLWDNIRANKGSGKKPTAAMLKQERKIKAKFKK